MLKNLMVIVMLFLSVFSFKIGESWKVCKFIGVVCVRKFVISRVDLCCIEGSKFVLWYVYVYMI